MSFSLPVLPAFTLFLYETKCNRLTTFYFLNQPNSQSSLQSKPQNSLTLPQLKWGIPQTPCFGNVPAPIPTSFLNNYVTLTYPHKYLAKFDSIEEEAALLWMAPSPVRLYLSRLSYLWQLVFSALFFVCEFIFLDFSISTFQIHFHNGWKPCYNNVLNL